MAHTDKPEQLQFLLEAPDTSVRGARRAREVDRDELAAETASLKAMAAWAQGLSG